MSQHILGMELGIAPQHETETEDALISWFISLPGDEVPGRISAEAVRELIREIFTGPVDPLLPSGP